MNKRVTELEQERAERTAWFHEQFSGLGMDYLEVRRQNAALTSQLAASHYRSEQIAQDWKRELDANTALRAALERLKNASETGRELAEARAQACAALSTGKGE